MTAGAIPFDDGQARRNAVILALAQAFYGAAYTALVVTAGLVGSQFGAFRLPAAAIRLLMAAVLAFASVKLLT